MVGKSDCSKATQRQSGALSLLFNTHAVRGLVIHHGDDLSVGRGRSETHGDVDCQSEQCGPGLDIFSHSLDQLPTVAGTAQARMVSTDRDLLLRFLLYSARATRVLDEGTAIDHRIADTMSVAAILPDLIQMTRRVDTLPIADGNL